jgi:hypothetical protein
VTVTEAVPSKVKIEGIGLPTKNACCQAPEVDATVMPSSVTVVNAVPFGPGSVPKVTTPALTQLAAKQITVARRTPQSLVPAYSRFRMLISFGFCPGRQVLAAYKSRVRANKNSTQLLYLNPFQSTKQELAIRSWQKDP